MKVNTVVSEEEKENDDVESAESPLLLPTCFNLQLLSTLKFTATKPQIERSRFSIFLKVSFIRNIIMGNTVSNIIEKLSQSLGKEKEPANIICCGMDSSGM